MRLAILATALAVGTAGAVPADAAAYPVCAVHLVSVEGGGTASCGTSQAPRLALAVTRRVMTVYVRNGVADATLSCGAFSTTKRITAPAAASIVLGDSASGCTAGLAAVTDLTVAAATSTFTYIFPR